MRKLLLIAVAFSLFCCGKKDEAKIPEAKTDTIQKPIVGADKDEHGCKTSAGYTWSQLSGECVRIFEKGTRLDPFENTDGAVMSAFVIFKNDEAEVFIQTQKPMILRRRAEGEPFVNGKWQLIPWKGYVLKNDGKILFTGQ